MDLIVASPLAPHRARRLAGALGALALASLAIGTTAGAQPPGNGPRAAAHTASLGGAPGGAVTAAKTARAPHDSTVRAVRPPVPAGGLSGGVIANGGLSGGVIANATGRSAPRS